MASHSRPTSRGADQAGARSLKHLLRSLASDAAQLVRQEIALARAEMRQAVRRIVGGSSRIAVGAGVGATGALTLLAALVILLGELLGNYWLAALLVGGVLAAAGAWAAFAGSRKLRAVDPTPRMAAASVRETVQWARREAGELRATLLGGTRYRLPGGGHRRVLPPGPPGAWTLRPEEAVPDAGAKALAPRRNAPVAAAPGAAVRGTRVQRQPPPRQLGTIAFLRHVGREIQEDEITGHAAKLAYYAFMAMPPALMALFGLAGLVGSGRFAAWLQEQAALALPATVSEDIIGPFIEQVVLQKAPGPFSIGLLLALWGGSSIFLGLIDTLNHAYDIEESRPFLKKRALALGTMLAGVLLFVAAAGALLVGPAVLDAVGESVGMGRAAQILWNVAQWPLAFLFMVGAFWCAYYFLPNRDQKGSRVVLLKAAALAAALWVLATAGFRLYIANFSSYSETYGFLGAFIILLLWLYVTGLVVLAGGELASEMERRAS